MRISDWSSDVCSSDLGSAFGICSHRAQGRSPISAVKQKAPGIETAPIRPDRVIFGQPFECADEGIAPDRWHAVEFWNQRMPYQISERANMVVVSQSAHVPARCALSRRARSRCARYAGREVHVKRINLMSGN